MDRRATLSVPEAHEVHIQYRGPSRSQPAQGRRNWACSPWKSGWIQNDACIFESIEAPVAVRHFELSFGVSLPRAISDASLVLSAACRTRHTRRGMHPQKAATAGLIQVEKPGQSILSRAGKKT